MKTRRKPLASMYIFKSNVTLQLTGEERERTRTEFLLMSHTFIFEGEIFEGEIVNFKY